MSDSEKNTNKGLLGMIERVGNKLPHPVIIFIIFAIGIIFISEISVRLGLSAPMTNPETEKRGLLKLYP